MRIHYKGDIARIYAGGELLTDNFYYGEPLVIGLSRIPTELLNKSLEVRILPLQAQAPIYLPSGARPAIQLGDQLADIEEINFVPVYREVMQIGQ